MQQKDLKMLEEVVEVLHFIAQNLKEMEEMVESLQTLTEFGRKSESLQNIAEELAELREAEVRRLKSTIVEPDNPFGCWAVVRVGGRREVGIIVNTVRNKPGHKFKYKAFTVKLRRDGTLIYPWAHDVSIAGGVRAPEWALPSSGCLPRY
ncbi:hypothetical protein [Paenibacillus alkalitolerans]|uniref:hypothetical protein n=1 Tax=Paenibacillus alkalitolerans TaxID=2799335 RepID=UPI0018F79D9C|nr:hypothetical protein [Paenibacillus alkalitolerans]